MSFTEQLANGKVAESAITKWLIKRGHCVMPVYEISENQYKGPQLFTGGGGLIAPDILAIKNGTVLWIESKHKSAFSWYRVKQCFETGIDIRHYNDYLQIAESTLFPVWLLFLHRGESAKDSPPSPSGLFGNDIAKLRDNESHRSDKWGPSGMVYWTTTDYGGPLKKIAPLEDFDS